MTPSIAMSRLALSGANPKFKRETSVESPAAFKNREKIRCGGARAVVLAWYIAAVLYSTNPRSLDLKRCTSILVSKNLWVLNKFRSFQLAASAKDEISLSIFSWVSKLTASSFTGGPWGILLEIVLKCSFVGSKVICLAAHLSLTFVALFQY